MMPIQTLKASRQRLAARAAAVAIAAVLGVTAYSAAPAFIAALTDLCMQHMQGWPTARADAATRTAEAEQGRARAMHLGAER